MRGPVLKSSPLPSIIVAGVVSIALSSTCAGGVGEPSDGSLTAASSSSADVGTSVSDGLNPQAGTSGGSSGASAVGTSGSTNISSETLGTDTETSTPVTCEGEVVRNDKRIVRLSFNQISRTFHALIGDDFGTAIDVEYQIGPNAAVARTFPPLSSPQEGGTITTGMWQKLDLMASEAGEYTRANLTQVTGCGAEPTDECAQSFVQSFAELAYRKPLTATETDSILQVYDEVKEIYGTIPEAIQYSVYAALMSPQMLYRTEIGESKDQAGPLTAHGNSECIVVLPYRWPSRLRALGCGAGQEADDSRRSRRAGQTDFGHTAGPKRTWRAHSSRTSSWTTWPRLRSTIQRSAMARRRTRLSACASRLTTSWSCSWPTLCGVNR